MITLKDINDRLDSLANEHIALTAKIQGTDVTIHGAYSPTQNFDLMEIQRERLKFIEHTIRTNLILKEAWYGSITA